MPKSYMAAALLLAVVLLAGIVYAADASRGETLAQMGCRCHRPGEFEDWSESELLEKLKAYKSGELDHRVMSRQADRYSEQELADIAAYYAAD
jgi:cytochrome c553